MTELEHLQAHVCLAFLPGTRRVPDAVGGTVSDAGLEASSLQAPQ